MLPGCLHMSGHGMGRSGSRLAPSRNICTGLNKMEDLYREFVGVFSVELYYISVP